MTDVKPVTFKQGVPKAEKNGFFGLEEKLMDAGIDEQYVAVVVFTTNDVIHKQRDDVSYPVLQISAIEPLLMKESADAAVELLQKARQDRTGQEQIDFDGLGAEGDDEAEEAGA